MKKKIVTIAMLAALAVGSVAALTGCGGGEAASSAAPESSSSVSSAAETVSEEVSSEKESEYDEIELDTDTKGVADLIDVISVKNGSFTESPLEIAKRFKIALDFYSNASSGDTDYNIIKIAKDRNTGKIMMMLEPYVSIFIEPNEADSGVTSKYIMVIDSRPTEEENATRYEKVIGTALFGASYKEYTPSQILSSKAAADERACVFADTSTIIEYGEGQDGKQVPASISIRALTEDEIKAKE